MELRFDGKVVVVTGAGGGLGRDHAMTLAARGASVVINDIGFTRVDGGEPSSGPAEQVAREIEARGGRVVFNTEDASTAAGGQRIIDQALDSFGRLDAVINNAGTAGGIPFMEMTEKDFDFMVKNHLYTSFNVTKAAWAPLIKQGGGRIVMTTSGNGLFGMAGMAHYGAGKAGIYGLTRCLALEGAPVGISVNAYWPSALTRQIGAAGELRERMERTMPIAKSAPVAIWLAHEDCPLTGEVLHGGSGRVSRVFVAETPGVAMETLTAEAIGENVDQIRQEDGYFVFKTAMESSLAQTEIVRRQLGR